MVPHRTLLGTDARRGDDLVVNCPRSYGGSFSAPGPARQGHRVSGAEADGGLEVGQGLGGVDDLDSGHAYGLGRLQVVPLRRARSAAGRDRPRGSELELINPMSEDPFEKDGFVRPGRCGY